MPDFRQSCKLMTAHEGSKHLNGTHVPVEEPSTASKADIEARPFDVRFTPKSGHDALKL